MPDSVPPIAVSIGDPAGIGPDIILQSWARHKEIDIPRFTVIGDRSILNERAKLLKIPIDIYEVRDAKLQNNHENELCVLPLNSPMQCTAGIAENQNSKGVIEAITRGVEMVQSGAFSALTTCPINKKALYNSGFEFPGHTEFLADLAAKLTGNNVSPVMMLAGPQLRSVPVTIHMALSAVKDVLTKDLIVQTARITAKDLRDYFGIKNPVLAIAGVNPHAGEEGAMGREEIEFIAPAVDILKSEGINVIGPLPADTMFHERARAAYDVAICMYHDQALIPAKTLGFDDAVNVTLGLPFIRTSPDHGTAYEIAGTGKAKPGSFIAALKMARDMAHHRKQNS